VQGAKSLQESLQLQQASGLLAGHFPTLSVTDVDFLQYSWLELLMSLFDVVSGWHVVVVLLGKLLQLAPPPLPYSVTAMLHEHPDSLLL
jgi:hypothetical protein